MPQIPRPTFTEFLAITLGTGLGVGFIPFAPGTFGSVWGPILIGAVLQTHWPIGIVAVIGVVFIGLGVPICTHAAKALGKEDPGSVVFDEIAAFWIVFLPHLVGWIEFSWFSAIVGFTLFRVFDISKPWPVSRLEHLPEGAGIMADDLAAGAYACVLLVLAELLWSGLLPSYL